MSKTNYAKCSNFFVLVFLIVFIHFCASAPLNVTENTYTQFIAELNRKKCSVPSQVQLPFDTTKVNNFEYLSSYLEICQKTESTKRNKEAVVLCNEIYDNIRNISCPTQIALPDIAVNLSKNVCQDIGARKDSIPEDDKSLLKRITDSFLCDIMCDTEFEKACQVLLWSFQVRESIAKVASPQEPEQPNVPEDGGELNDSVKQDNTLDETGLPQIKVSTTNSENGEKNAEEAKDIGRGGITEIPEPRKLEDNPNQTLNIRVISGKAKQKSPVSNDKESDLENQAVPMAKSPDSTPASKSTSDVKTSTTLTEQVTVVQTSNSNTKVKPAEEATKSESNDQNGNKQLQGGQAKHDDVNVGVGLSQDFKSNVVTDEQAQVDANTLGDRGVQDEKDAHGQDNSHVPANQNFSSNDDVPGNEIPGESPKKGDQNSDFPGNNDLHESGNEKSPSGAIASLQNDEHNPSNHADIVTQNRLQSTATKDDRLAVTIDINQTVKDVTQHQSVHETTQDETSIDRDETKVDQSQAKPLSGKVEAQNYTKTNVITDNKTRIPSTDQKKPEVPQQTEEFDNTIPEASETVVADEKPPEKSQKSKTTAMNPDGKNVIPSSLTETSSKTAVALERMEGGNDYPQQPDREAESFGDTEFTEEDYAKPDYGQQYDTKNKESDPDLPVPDAAAREKIVKNEKQIGILPRNGFDTDSGNYPYSSFPQQEDSHFFFYFLSIVLILMAGYLIFHNKQKIIALIVEGRHERNRRSHRIGYKKLETK